MRLRLKTKLVLAITGMVFAVVVTLSLIYISQLVKQRIDEVYNNGEFVTKEIFDAARLAIHNEFEKPPAEGAPTDVNARALSGIKNDPHIPPLLDSITGQSPVIWSASIVDSADQVLLYSGPAPDPQVEHPRSDFVHVKVGNFWKQLRVVYGPTHEYSVSRPILLNDQQFATVRVTVNTVFIKDQVQRLLVRSTSFSAIAILVSIILAAALSNLALRPLELISEQLDRMALGPDKDAASAKLDEDEYGQVSSKVDRIGRQMRDVQEVFTALKDNLDQIMANLQDGIMLFTREAKAVLVSASVETFLGKPRRELLGFSVQEIFRDSRSLSPLDAFVLNAFREHQAFQNFEVEGRAGKAVFASIDFIEEGGERLGALLTLRDAESVRKIEDELEISRRLAAIGRLTSGVAHEVKNPINAIVVHLEVLRQKLVDLPPDTKRHMDIITNEIHRLDRVVHTLVEFYRPVELRLAEFDLNRLVDDVVMLAKLEAASHGHNVELRLASEPLTVRADYDMLKQALLNIILNGLQAMEGKPAGSLHISSAVTRENAGVIRVRDEGSGIPPDIQDKIYNLYFTTKPAGSGIGLAMTYRILQLHGGGLQFKTGERGTEFSMELPLTVSADASYSESARQKTA